MAAPKLAIQTADTAFPTVPVLTDFLDLKPQFQAIRADVMNAVARVLESQKFILGEEVRLFEEEIAQAMHAGHAVACASGSDALLLALMAAGIQEGDEVITTPFTFVATASAVARLGARPVFVDIEPETFNIDPQKIEAALTPRTRAIIPVHLFGLPADLDRILCLADAHRLTVVEDAAQAILADYKGQLVGTTGTFGCFSFFPSKNLGCAGDGGMVTTQNPASADRLRMLRAHGSRKKYQHEILGMNSRLDALQAAILRIKLRHLNAWTVSRREVAGRYFELFRARGLSTWIVLPSSPSGSGHVFNQFTLRCAQRDRLREFLRASGIPTEIYYPAPLHCQPVFSYLGYRKGDFPEAERASLEVLSLPIYPELEESQQRAVVAAIAQFYESST